ncbi:MAG TPA: M55 family metallopeptidase [Thermotogota bacterium]|nr:M55 family metallopeptidase [Thermotogota bacterium]HPJ89017.1 M55 family metallopeptidase [Thermotogota bacterium]HPR95528.1 M55 family metallopeptidase [Thermotogota bacterium]
MKLFISIDMEGIAGTFNWKQEKTFGERQIIKRNVRRQVEWVIEGIHQSSVNEQIDEIVIADSHDMGDNLEYDITELDDRLYLISGSPRPQYMMADFDKRFDVVFFLGYHAGIGTERASMDHTFSNSAFYNISINGMPVSESLLNAAYAGYHGVPVGLITGDLALKEQLEKTDQLQWIEYVVNKSAITRYAAKHYPINVVRKNTIEAVKKVLSENLKELPVFTFASDFDHPIELRIELCKTEMADVVQFMPGCKRLNARTVLFKDHCYKTLFDTITAISALAKSVS